MLSSVGSKLARTIRISRSRAPALTTTTLRLSSTTTPTKTISPYTDKDFAMWKEEFRALKSYKTESISGDELGALFRAVGYERSDAQTKKYIEYINGVHGGRIELKDFYRYMSTQHDPAQILVKFVHDFDKDKDGYISAEEFKYVLETVEIHDPSVKTGPVSFQDLLREADTNKDGKISIAEMVAWLMSKRT